MEKKPMNPEKLRELSNSLNFEITFEKTPDDFDTATINTLHNENKDKIINLIKIFNSTPEKLKEEELTFLLNYIYYATKGKIDTVFRLYKIADEAYILSREEASSKYKDILASEEEAIKFLRTIAAKEIRKFKTFSEEEKNYFIDLFNKYDIPRICSDYETAYRLESNRLCGKESPEFTTKKQNIIKYILSNNPIPENNGWMIMDEILTQNPAHLSSVESLEKSFKPMNPEELAKLKDKVIYEVDKKSVENINEYESAYFHQEGSDIIYYFDLFNNDSKDLLPDFRKKLPSYVAHHNVSIHGRDYKLYNSVNGKKILSTRDAAYYYTLFSSKEKADKYIKKTVEIQISKFKTFSIKEKNYLIKALDVCDMDTIFDTYEKAYTVESNRIYKAEEIYLNENKQYVINYILSTNLTEENKLLKIKDVLLATDNDTIGHIYSETKFEDRKYQVSNSLKTWIERGKKVVNNPEEWEQFVNKSFTNRMAPGAGIAEALDLMEKLDSGEEFDALANLIDEKKGSYPYAINIVLRFSDKGPDFMEYYENTLINNEILAGIYDESSAKRYERYAEMIKEQREKNAQKGVKKK